MGNKHRNQHEEVGYGGLEHINDASREVVGQDKRRDGPLSRDRNRFGSIRRRGPLRLVAGGSIFLNCTFQGPVECTTVRSRSLSMITVARSLPRCPVCRQLASETIYQSLQYGEEKDRNRCARNCAGRRWSPGFEQDVVTPTRVEIHHHLAGISKWG